MSPARQQKHDIVVIGGSAGALEALKELVALLPRDLKASILVVIHIPADFPSYIPHILASSGKLPAVEATQNQKMETGVIYVAPPDHHLLLEDGHLDVSRGPRENRHRPAIDPLFRSAARAYGSRVIGVVLSGQLDDGSSGLMAVKMRGGMTVVQDTKEALCPEMPVRAKEYAGAEYELPVAGIVELLRRATIDVVPSEAPVGEDQMTGDIGREADKAELEKRANKEKDGKPSAYACPECHGVLWEVEEGNVLRFRCRVGHAYTADTLRGGLSESVEDALWAAMRSLEEKASLLRRIGARSNERNAIKYEQEAKGFDQHVETIRKLLVQMQEMENKDRAKSAAS